MAQPRGSSDPVAAAGNNWVKSSFLIHWTGPTSGIYDGQLPGATSFESNATVVNDIVSGQELSSASGSLVDDGPNQG